MDPENRFRSVRRALAALLVAYPLLAGCATAPPPAAPEPALDAAPSVVEVTLLHINDVYEITPVEGGRSGGLARVATLRERLAAENPHTLMLLGGDLFSPSAIGTAKVAGERLAGRQMVAVLNRVGLDWATFGNHEFDVSEDAFRSRLAESEFGWVSGNVTTAAGEPWPGVEPWTVVTFGEAGGPSLRLGILGATLQAGDPDWVKVTDPIPALAAQARALRDEVDVLVALTHLALDQDQALVETVPEIDLVLGGHEHENWELRRGAGFTPVFKADANVRSVYVLRLRYDTATRELVIDDELVPVTAAIPEDPETAAVVEHWVELAFAGFRADGFEPEAAVATIPEALDGHASSVRNRPTNLTDLIAAAMLAAAADDGMGAQAAVFNSGSIRIDDALPSGPVTQYDVIRVLPFPSAIALTEMTGALLTKVLDQGLANQGSGGYLQKAGVTRAEGGWWIGGAPVDPAATYRVALTDFLLTGREANLGYLTPDNPDLKVIETLEDVREAVIAELERRYGSPGS